jgi:hypothetical protein
LKEETKIRRKKTMKKLLVLLTAAAMVFAFAASVSAAEFNFYGNARLHTFSWEDSKEVNAQTFLDEYNKNEDEGVAFDESDRDLDMSLGAISRFGAKINISDELTANVEFGMGATSESTSLSLRHLNGEYDFGAGKILVGQYWHPFAVNVGYSNQVGNGDDGLGNVGGFTTGRVPQIRLNFGDFALHFMSPKHPTIAGIGNAYNDALIVDPSVPDYDLGLGVTPGAYYDDDVSWPHVAAVYNAAYENFTFGITGSFQSYEVSDTRGTHLDLVTLETVTGKSYDVDSYGLKFGMQGNFGLFTLGVTYGFGENLGNMGIEAQSGKDDTPGAFYDAVNDKIGDVETSAYTIVGAFKVNDMVTLEAGYGKVSNDIDGGLQDDESNAYYLQAAINIADGFVVTPEIGKYDYEEDENGKDEGDATYFGAKWQINF